MAQGTLFAQGSKRVIHPKVIIYVPKSASYLCKAVPTETCSGAFAKFGEMFRTKNDFI